MLKPATLLPLAVATILAAVAIACTGAPLTTAPAPSLTEPPPATDVPASDAADAAPEPTAVMPQPEPSAMNNPHSLDAFPPEAAYGDYAVGTATSFAVDNRQRLDPWNTAYNTAYASPATGKCCAR